MRSVILQVPPGRSQLSGRESGRPVPARGPSRRRQEGKQRERGRVSHGPLAGGREMKMIAGIEAGSQLVGPLRIAHHPVPEKPTNQHNVSRREGTRDGSIGARASRKQGLPPSCLIGHGFQGASRVRRASRGGNWKHGHGDDLRFDMFAARALNFDPVGVRITDASLRASRGSHFGPVSLDREVTPYAC